MYVYMYVCMYIYIHTHTHAHTILIPSVFKLYWTRHIICSIYGLGYPRSSQRRISLRQGGWH